MKSLHVPNERTGNVNAVGLGMRTSRNFLLPGEDVAEFQHSADSLLAHLQPQTQAEVDAVQRLVGIQWKLHRIERHEHLLLLRAIEEASEALPEKKTLDLARRAQTAVSATIEMMPLFSNAIAEVAMMTMVDTMRTVNAMVDALAARHPLAPGVLGELGGAVNSLSTLSAIGVASNDEYLAMLGGLGSALVRAQSAIDEAVAVLEELLKKKREELVITTTLKTTDYRLLGRYRASLERSRERELNHLRHLFELRKSAGISFGSGLPAQFPPVELKLVQ